MRSKCERHFHKTSTGRFVMPELLIFVLLPASIATAAADPPGASAPKMGVDAACPAAATSRAAIANIDERLEITLKDGRALRLAGFEPPRPTPDAPDFDIAARDAFRARAGAEIGFVSLAQQPDRWGRIPVFAFFDAQLTVAGQVPATQFLLARGFGRYMPDLEARPCRVAFLAAEEAARKSKLGLWRDPFYAVIEATDRDAFPDRTATNVIVEGRLAAVDSGPLRTELRFGRSSARGFSVMLTQRNATRLERTGWNFRALINQVLRVRGLLDLRFGPEIEVSTADQIELLPETESDRGLKIVPPEMSR